MTIDFNYLKKKLRSNTQDLPAIKAALLGDAPTQLLSIALKGYAIENGVLLDLFEAEYDQVSQLVYDRGSDLYKSKPGYIIICNSTEKLLQRFWSITSDHERAIFHQKHLEYITSLYNTIKNTTEAKVIYANYPEIDDSVYGNFSNKHAGTFTYQVRKINAGLMDLSIALSDLFICDISSLQNEHGRKQFFAPVSYVTSGLTISLECIPDVALQFTRIIMAIEGRFMKCVILDLDNTIWGGIIGDDGMEGIQIGGLGIGKAFSEMQMWIKQLKNRGIIVAVCSKNDETIAKEPFHKHPDMVLRLEDIAVFVANWENKVSNIQYIQTILNIGFDSMVFLDDNPFEREMVKSAIPELCVPSLPGDPAEYLTYLRTLNLFETASYSENDRNRGEQYLQEARRVELKSSYSDEGDFLSSLEMKIDVKEFDLFSVPRLAQLSQRSNQFNLRTIRYTNEQVKGVIEDKNRYGIQVALKDRFGSYGLISMVILERKEDALFIDSWIMSCRVLKRGVEHFVLDKLVELAKQCNVRFLHGEYIPSAKNGLVKDHYKTLGFMLCNNNIWQLDVETYRRNDTYIQEGEEQWV